MSVMSVVQGEYKVSDTPDVRLTTVLGSCIAACVVDNVAKIGGMNHFLLPEAKSGAVGDVKYGAFLMELLVNDLLKAGASKSNMTASLYGGSKMNAALGNVGERNISFARRYLENEGIPLRVEDVGGDLARRIMMDPTSGQVDVRFIEKDQDTVPVERVNRQERKSNVELF